MADAAKAEAPKKPVGGAYGVFTNEKRDEFKKQAASAGDKSFGGPAKLASAAWKALSDAEKAPYQQKYEEAKAAHDAYKASDSYVAPEKKAKRGDKEKKAEKDKDAPKRPVGGAYGAFMNEKRSEFQKKVEEAGGKSFGGAAKLASAAWGAMSDADKAAYEEKYQATKAKYEADMATYKASKPEADSPAKSDESSPKKSPAKKSPTKKSPKSAAAKAAATKVSPEKAAKGAKRKASASPSEPAKKRGPKATKDEPSGPQLDAALLKEADDCGMRASLQNLAGRKEVVEKGFDGKKLLQALQAADGLVNKAKAALFGGA